MKLPELIDRCYLDRPILDDKRIYTVILANYTQEEIAKLLAVFLDGINKTHSIQGNTIYTLTGILNSHLDGFELTTKQKVFAVMGILDNWNQLSLLAKIELDI
jgi:hypothetical protein